MAIAHHGDLYIPSDSPVHRWAVGSKLLSLLSFMFAVAIVRQLVLVPLALGLVALLYGLSRLPWRDGCPTPVCLWWPWWRCCP